MVTRSANDAAVVVAENLAGAEDEFARLMTRKARALGMSNTDLSQRLRPAGRRAGHHGARPGHRSAAPSRSASRATTAISRPARFTFRGQRIGNHNRLLGKVEGVDGIKTGYTRASGFNLVTSVQRDDRHVVAVVLGGTQRRRARRAHARAARRTRRQRLDPAHRADDRRSAGARSRRTAAQPQRAPAIAPRQRFEMASAAHRRRLPKRRAASRRAAPDPTRRLGRADPPVHGEDRCRCRPGTPVQTASAAPIASAAAAPRPAAPSAADADRAPTPAAPASARCRRRPAPPAGAAAPSAPRARQPAPRAAATAAPQRRRRTAPRRRVAAADPHRLDHPGRRLPGRERSQAAALAGQEQGRRACWPRRALHRAGAARATRRSIAPASPGSTRIRRKPPASFSSATTSTAWRSRTDSSSNRVA